MRVDVGELPFERTLPLGEGRLLLGQLGRALGPVAIGILELAELGRDLLLARGRSCLGGEELGLQVSEALLLCGGRFGALRQLLLALLERRLLGGDLRCARVDLRRAKRQALGVGEALLQPRLDIRELVAYLPLAGDRGRKLGPDGLQLTFQLTFQLAVRLADLLGRGDDRGLDRRRGSLGLRGPLRGVGVLFGLRLFLVAAPLELAPEAGPEALLGLVVLIAERRPS